MEVPTNMDALAWLRKHVDGSDVLHEMVRAFAEALMDAEAEVLCNAGYREVTRSGSTAATGVGSGVSTPGSARSSRSPTPNRSGPNTPESSPNSPSASPPRPDSSPKPAPTS